MRFKLILNQRGNTLKINCLNDNVNQKIILPEDPTRHVFFPIPNEMKEEIEKELTGLIDEKDSAEIISIENKIKELTELRTKKMNSLRSKINPKIIETCENFRVEHAEKFI